MYRSAIRTLFVAAALLLTTTACDTGGDSKADGKKADSKKAEGGDAKAEGGDAKAEGGDAKADEGGAANAEAGAAGAEEGGAAGETGAVAAGAEAGGEAGAEAGGAAETGAAAAAEGGEEGGKDDGGKTDGGKDVDKPKDPEPTAKIDGKPLFEQKCKSCHGIDGKGDTTIGKKVDIPSLAKTSLSKAKIGKIIEDGVPDTKMKAYKGKLSKDEIDAVAAYVKKL